MRHLLNTLYVTTQGAYLHKEGETVAVNVEKVTKLRVPLHNLAGIVCFGLVSWSPALMHACCERNMLLSCLSENGRFLGRVSGPVSGNVLVRRAQYRLADDLERSAGVARNIVIGKGLNSRTVLLRAARDHPDADGVDAVASAAEHIRRSLKSIETPQPLETVRGIEGEIARTYFGVFDHLITNQKDAFRFERRSRRPPLDNTNALLSFLYTLVLHDVVSAVETAGLDPAVGFLHRDRPGRPGLALDLMEEMRPVLADRLALSLINRQQVRAEGFTTSETGAVAMDDATRKELLVAYQARKQDEVTHPFLDEKIPLGLVPHAQALLFSRWLRGDLDAYPPYLWR